MDVTIVCTAITGLATVVCAYLGLITTKNGKEVEKRAQQRAKEGKLQLKMLNANSQLTIGVAMALKNGHCNGEVEDGLKAVKEANEEYTHFLEEIAIEVVK